MRQMQTLVLGLTLVASLAGATENVIDAIVAANYPSSLTATAAKYHYMDARQRVHAVIGGRGESMVVAAYSNGQVGAVALLDGKSNGRTLLDLASYPFVGSAPDIQLRDVDGDDVPDAIIEFDTGKGGAQTWVFKIVDRKLRLLTPTDKSRHAVLGLPDFVSIGEGRALDVVDAVNLGSRREPVISHLHFVLQNGVYTQVAPFDFYKEFRRSGRGPEAETVTFDIAGDAIAKPYRLVIGNGGGFGAEQRASSGEVRLNGIVVSGASDFSKSRATWSIPVTLQQLNTISVQLKSAPGSRIAVAIRHD